MFSVIVNNLFYTGLSCLIFFFSGLGLTMLFCPKGLRRYTLFLSPIVGYCYVVLAGWHMSTFGMEAVYNNKGQITAVRSVSALNFHGTDSYAWLILLPPVVFLITAVYKYRGKLRESAGVTERGLVAPLIMGVLALVLLSVPLFRHGDGLSPISFGNLDIVDNTLKARFLKEFSFSDTEGYLSHLEEGYNFQKHYAMTNRFGTPFAAAFLSSIFSTEANQSPMIVTNAFFFFGILLFYALLREVFGYERFPSLMVAALYGLSPIMYYLVYMGFTPQVTGMTLATAFFLLQFRAIETSAKFSDYTAYIPILALINWGVNSTYTHMLPFIYIPVVAYMAMRAVNNKSLKGFAGWAGFQAAVLLLTTIFSPFRVKVLAENLLFHAGMEAGWAMPYFSLDYILGLNYIDIPPLLHPFYGYYMTHFEPLLGFLDRSALIHWVVSIPIIIAAFTGLSKVFTKDRRVFLVSIACLLVIFGGYNYIYFFIPVSADYKSFKLVAFFLPLALPALLLAFRDVGPKSKGLILISLVAVTALAALVFGVHSFKGLYVSRDLAEVKKIESMPQVESVNLLGDNRWEMVWQTTFLMKKKLYWQSTLPGWTQGGVIDGQWDLVNVLTTGMPPKECMEDAIPMNSTYMLMKARGLDDEAMRANIRLAGNLQSLRPGESMTVPISVKNTSGSVWSVECNMVRKLYLTYTWVSDAGGKMAAYSMGGAPLPRTLKPGEETTIDLAVNAPRETGKYLLVLDMLQENVSWFRDKGSKPLAIQAEIR